MQQSSLTIAARAQYAIANVNLGVATLADLGIVPVAPLAAVVLVGTNLKTFAMAGRQVRRRELGLPVLYTAIVAGTLAKRSVPGLRHHDVDVCLLETAPAG